MGQGQLFDPGPGGGAILSEDRLHRFRLWRHVGPTMPSSRPFLWVMLNPSTADETTNDLTIKKCLGFCERWNDAMDSPEGFTLEVVNLFSYRATEPADLWVWLAQHGPPFYQPPDVMKANEEAILHSAAAARRIILAWGAQTDPAFRAVSARVAEQLERLGFELWCLGTTKDGHPRHPSRLGYATELVRYVHPR